MTQLVVEKPYEFIPPMRGEFWPRIIGLYLPRYLRRAYGVTRIECHGESQLRESIQRGDGVLLAPNHCRACDPFVMNSLARAVGKPFYVMASWHTFHLSKLNMFLMPRAGAFSVYREGMDKTSLAFATSVLENAERPLVVFPEGHITRSNDRLDSLLEGVSLIARQAARKRSKVTPPGRVVVHPIFLRYKFTGDLSATITPIIEQLETRLTWRVQRGLPLADRVKRIGWALLSLKEVEHMGAAREGTIEARLRALVDHMLHPLEKEHLSGPQEGAVFPRVKRLRMAIVPALVQAESNLSDDDRKRRWRQLEDLYLVQQLGCYPPGYLGDNPSADRVLELIEAFDEDLTDKTTMHGPVTAQIHVAPAIEVSPERDRGGGGDALMEQIEREMMRLMEATKAE